MLFHDPYPEDAYARRILARAQIRAMARRQLALSIPVAAAGAFFAIVSTFAFGHAAPPNDDRRAPVSAPASLHPTMLCSTGPSAAVAPI